MQFTCQKNPTGCIRQVCGPHSWVPLRRSYGDSLRSQRESTHCFILNEQVFVGRNPMSKYLIQASYTQSGVQGLLKEGGSSRRQALTQTVEGLGGTLEAIYYAYGDVDLLMVVDLPDESTAAALSMFIGAAGALNVSMTVLISPETIDDAIRKNVQYRAPGD